MKENLTEALAIVEEPTGCQGRYPVSLCRARLLRVRKLLCGVLAGWWDEDDVTVLAPSNPADDDADGVDLAEVGRAVNGIPTAPSCTANPT